MELLLWFGVGWLVIAAVLAVLIGKAIHQGFDEDAPEGVARRDWDRVKSGRPRW